MLISTLKRTIIVFKGGVVYEKDYEYDETAGECRVGNLKRMKIDLAGYKYVRAADYQDKETLLKQALYEYGPIVVTVHTSVQFMYYSNGIFFEKDCHKKAENENLLHVVLLVGYGSKDGIDYWIAKNSWGKDWGDKGYIKVRRNSTGDCGFHLYDAYFPIFEEDVEVAKRINFESTTIDSIKVMREMKSELEKSIENVNIMSKLSIIFCCVIFSLTIYLIILIRSRLRITRMTTS